MEGWHEEQALKAKEAEAAAAASPSAASPSTNAEVTLPGGAAARTPMAAQRAEVPGVGGAATTPAYTIVESGEFKMHEVSLESVGWLSARNQHLNGNRR